MFFQRNRGRPTTLVLKSIRHFLSVGTLQNIMVISGVVEKKIPAELSVKILTSPPPPRPPGRNFALRTAKKQMQHKGVKCAISPFLWVFKKDGLYFFFFLLQRRRRTTDKLTRYKQDEGKRRRRRRRQGTETCSQSTHFQTSRPLTIE